MWGAALGLAGYAAKKLGDQHDDKKVVLMGIMGAFVFAAQMINFSIPLTGSSGHLGGGLLLSIILGPYAGFLAMFSILFLQALLFADGGLLALGCNIINLGFFSCFVAWPLIYRPLSRQGSSSRRSAFAAILAVVAGLQVGAFSVVLQTLLSGRTALPFASFVLLMQPIHLAIGLVEGVITAAIVLFVQKSSPETIYVPFKTANSPVPKRILLTLSVLTLVTAGVVSLWASSDPDGLEWAVEKITGHGELVVDEPLHQAFANVQSSIAPLPDYSLAAAGETAGTSLAGILGSLAVAVLVLAVGLLIRLFSRRRKKIKA